ncbi:hypothetical protein HAX54_035160 [Datura stramonium]|uniref:Uncharacterized protein n=1 Tax=Datura stramonium TaxID=4076 RepID=A0ABS8SFC8_DATST|nr:hypothetical protein [Datura stramonium]
MGDRVSLIGRGEGLWSFCRRIWRERTSEEAKEDLVSRWSEITGEEVCLWWCSPVERRLFFGQSWPKIMEGSTGRRKSHAASRRGESKGRSERECDGFNGGLIFPMVAG